MNELEQLRATVERVRAVLADDEKVWRDGGYSNDLVVLVEDVVAALDVTDRLADALEGTLTEPEWEYGVVAAAFGGEPEPHPTRDAALHVREHPELYRKWTHGSEVTVHRRRKAGEWEVVTDE